MKIRQAFKKLINNNFFLKIWHFTNRITFDPLIQIFFIEAHTDIKIVVFTFTGHIGSVNFTDKVIIQDFDNFDLSISVPRVLNHSFNRHKLSISSETAFVYFSKGSLTYLLQ